jgi:hypothetical protein
MSLPAASSFHTSGLTFQWRRCAQFLNSKPGIDIVTRISTPSKQVENGKRLWRIEWISDLFLLHAHRTTEVEETVPGQCELRSWEYFEKPLSWLVRWSVREGLERGFERTAEGLGMFAEGYAREAAEVVRAHGDWAKGAKRMKR